MQGNPRRNPLNGCISCTGQKCIPEQSPCLDLCSWAQRQAETGFTRRHSHLFAQSEATRETFWSYRGLPATTSSPA